MKTLATTLLAVGLTIGTTHAQHSTISIGVGSTYGVIGSSLGFHQDNLSMAVGFGYWPENEEFEGNIKTYAFALRLLTNPIEQGATFIGLFHAPTHRFVLYSSPDKIFYGQGVLLGYARVKDGLFYLVDIGFSRTRILGQDNFEIAFDFSFGIDL